MIPVKIECGCGQRYAFDVDPINGRMPSAVVCPVCGMDGTAAANASITHYLSTQPAIAAAPALHVAAPVAAAAPPVSPPPYRPPAIPSSAPKTGKDGWATEETSLNKIGTYVIIIPAILAPLFTSGTIPVEVPPMILWSVIGVAGIVGGILNILGRGPVWAGALVGLIMGAGGYGAVSWWCEGKEYVRKFEMVIAFMIGAAPGFLLQYVLQQILKKRAASA